MSAQYNIAVYLKKISIIPPKAFTRIASSVKKYIPNANNSALVNNTIPAVIQPSLSLCSLPFITHKNNAIRVAKNKVNNATEMLGPIEAGSLKI